MATIGVGGPRVLLRRLREIMAEQTSAQTRLDKLVMLIAAKIFGPLADAGVNVDMIVQNVSPDGKKTDLTFTVGRSELPRALDAIEKAREAIGYRDITSDDKVAKISIIGIGMRTHAGVAQTMFRTLSDKGINIQVISTSEIKVSVLIAEEYVELAVRALHSAYELDAA